jgi:hypothetical protein
MSNIELNVIDTLNSNRNRVAPDLTFRDLKEGGDNDKPELNANQLNHKAAVA